MATGRAAGSTRPRRSSRPSPRADRRARAEAAWLASGLPVHIFRLAGIYGPGRNAFVNLKDGTARRIVKPGQVFSRIHVEDIATVLEASIARPRPGAIYNVCDDEPAPPQDVVAYAAELMGVAPPPEQPYETAELSPMARTFYKDNRRVRNELIKRELGVRLAYPTYREGLSALLPGRRLSPLTHQPRHCQRRLVALLLQPDRHTLAIGRRPVLARLPLALDPRDRDLDADDRLDLRGDERLGRVLDGPRLGRGRPPAARSARGSA